MQPSRTGSGPSLAILALLASILGPAFGCAYDAERALFHDQFLQGDNDKVDILWVIDNSNSMEELQLALGLAFPTFLTVLQSHAIDWQMGITTTDMTHPDHRGRLLELGQGKRILSPVDPDLEDTFATAIAAGVEGSQLERGLATAWAATTPPLTGHENEGFIREDARLAVILLSDEDDCSDEGRLVAQGSSACVAQSELLVPVADFTSRFQDLKESMLSFAFHGIVETGPTAGFDGCGGTNPGPRYIEMAERSGGSLHRICDDFERVMEEVGIQVAGRRRAFPLARTPDVRSIEVRFIPANAGEDHPGNEIPDDHRREEGWTFNSDTNMLLFWGGSVPPLGSTLKVSYLLGTGD